MTATADQRILLGAPATLAAQFLDQEGDPVTPANAVTVRVTNRAGADVLPAGTATQAPPAAPAVRTVQLPAQAQLDVLTATWTEATTNRTVTTRIDVVGRFYASPSAVRSSDPTLRDHQAYPVGRIIQGRRAVEDEFERVIGYALVPRLDVWTSRIGSARSVTLPVYEVRRLVEVRLDGALVTNAELDGPAGLVYFPAPISGTLEVVYEHGLDAPPAEALEAFYVRARDVLNRDKRGVPDRTTTFTSELGGTYALAVAGRNSLTGIPDVDAVLIGLRRSTPGIG